MTTSTSPLFRLQIDGVDVPLRVTAVRGEERIHAPWRFEITCAARDSEGVRHAVSPDDLVARPARLSWPVGEQGDERVLDGFVLAVAASSGAFEITFAPRLALLAEAVDYRVFVDEDSITIASAVLQVHGISVEGRVARELPKRRQCVQAFESDLDFVARILSEEGIAFYLPVDRPDVVVLVDRPSGYDDLPGPDALRAGEGAGLAHRESVEGVKLRHRLVPDKVSLRDYNFETPDVDEGASADAGSSRREWYEYPGGYDEPSLGGTLAGIRLEELRGRRVLLQAKTGSRRIAPGCIITLDSDDARSSGRFLVVEVAHEAAERGRTEEGSSYSAALTFVPASIGYRPERPRSPRLGGVETGVVTGPAGTEIHTEQHGRVKVHHRWDRRRPADDTSSAWTRVVQPPTSGGLFLPRVGWEVLLAFQERSADVPLVLGRLVNGAAPPPAPLPAKSVVSAFGTATTPGGGSANGITLDDAAGAEKMSLVASKDLNERTENDKNTSVTANDTWTIGANATTIVGQVLDQTVGGAQSYSVGAGREVNVTANKVVNAASETVAVGGLRLFDIGGDHATGCSSLTRLVGAAKAELGIEHVNRAVQGAATTLVGGSWAVVSGTTNNVSVAGASTELVGGAKGIKARSYYANVKGAYSESFASRTVTAGGDRQEGFGAAASYDIASTATIKGSDVTVKATAKITLKAGGVTVTITPRSIKISGDFKGKVDAVDDGKVDYE